MSKMDLSGEDRSSVGGDSAENSGCDVTLTGPRWYMDPVFDRYWKSYNLAMGWFRYHHQLQTRIAPRQSTRGHPIGIHMPQGLCRSTGPSLPYMGRGLGNPFGVSGFEAQSSQPQSRTKQSKRKKRKMTSTKRAQLRARRTLSDRTNSEGGEEEPLFEMEITPEMREFFAKSAQHRRERAAKRKDSTGSDYIDLTEVTVNTKRATVAPPTERPGMRRTEQMKLLYGSGAAMIHGMETALQLNFDRNFDIKTPKLWPHLPLNITFHS